MWILAVIKIENIQNVTVLYQPKLIDKRIYSSQQQSCTYLSTHT